MSVKICARCGTRRSHSIHIRALSLEGNHDFQDASRAGLQPVSEARRAYQSSTAHQEAYASLGGACVAEAMGAPGQCLGPITPHHLYARSAAGGLGAADKYGVAGVCAYHNEAIEQDVEMRRWAELHTFVAADGLEWPLRITRGWLQAHPERIP